MTSRKKHPYADCICKSKIAHSPKCLKAHRNRQINAWRTAKRKKLKDQHLCTCIGCEAAVSPTIIYRQFCPIHKRQAQQLAKRARNKAKNKSRARPNAKKKIVARPPKRRGVKR